MLAKAQRVSLTVTTDADGNATAYVGPVNGRVQLVALGAGFDNLVDITITGRTSGEPILTLANHSGSASRYAPRRATHDTAGVASLYAGGGEPVEDFIWIVDEDIKVVVAQGGNAKSATFTFVVG